MKAVTRLLTNEPAAIAGFVNALLACIILFGVPVSEAQGAAIIVVVNIGLGLATRALVTPSGRFDKEVEREAEQLVEEVSGVPLTDEERATLEQMRAERDGLRGQVRAEHARRAVVDDNGPRP